MSTSSQDAQLQVDALVAAGVQKRDVFADVTSGSKTAIERRGMKKLLEYAEEGDTVVVWRVDRLGRSLIDVLNTVNLLRERGVQVRSISDGIDPSTSTGRLMLNMLATLAEYERELIVERVNAGIAAARASGTRFGRPLSDPAVVADKLAIAADARARGRTAEDAARLVGWSRATLYRHQFELGETLAVGDGVVGGGADRAAGVVAAERVGQIQGDAEEAVTAGTEESKLRRIDVASVADEHVALGDSQHEPRVAVFQRGPAHRGSPLSR